MRVCVCVRACVSSSVRDGVYECASVCMSGHTCVCVGCVCLSAYACVCVLAYVCTFAYVCVPTVRECVCFRACERACVYVCGLVCV